MRKSAARVVVVFVCGLVIVGLGLQIRRPGEITIDSGTRVIMGTFARVVAVAKDSQTAEAAIGAAFREQQQIEILCSYHRSDSELNRVNREAFDKPVKVDKRTFEVLQQALHFSKLSQGAFDVTVGPLMDLWRSAGEANAAPTDAAIAEARSKVGWQKMVLDANEMTVRFGVEGMKIDLGGIAKGYAIDKSIEAMKEWGLLGGMVDIGGNVRCFGKPAHVYKSGFRRSKAKWLIGLQDPNVAPDDLSPGKPVLVLKLTEGAVATSGHYRRFVTVQGKKQTHIMDPHSGYGSANLASVTIIAPDATTADALSTAVSVMGTEEGLALVEALPDVEVILILNDGKVLKSSGAERL